MDSVESAFFLDCGRSVQLERKAIGKMKKDRHETLLQRMFCRALVGSFDLWKE